MATNPNNSCPPVVLKLADSTTPLCELSFDAKRALTKAIIETFGQMDKIQPNRAETCLLLFPKDQSQKQELLKTKKILEHEVTITSIDSNWSNKGVIHNVPIELEGETELILAMENIGAESHKCIPAKSGNKMTVIISFQTKVASSLNIMGWSYPIKPYVPRPLQCKRCWRLNHSQHKCRSAAVCSNCHKAHEETDETCKNSKYCINCKTSDHSSVDARCPAILKKQNIIKLAIQRKISFTEAEMIINQGIPQGEKPSEEKQPGTRIQNTRPPPTNELDQTTEIENLKRRIEQLERRQEKAESAIKDMGALVAKIPTFEKKLSTIETNSKQLLINMDVKFDCLMRSLRVKRPASEESTKSNKQKPPNRREEMDSAYLSLPDLDMDIEEQHVLEGNWMSLNDVSNDD